ncbi:MAG: fused MFS/spermidine synthase [Candidatus Omnitrophota bacterium]
MNTSGAGRVRSVLYLLFFLSGIAGLIYEVLWSRYLSLIFGNTTYANTLVLATFMGGLALGSFFFGKFVDRVGNKLALYAWVEMAIAAFCIITPNLLVFSKNIYVEAAKGLLVPPLGMVALKFLIGALIMLPPTILMGGTLPILSKFFVQAISERGKVVARLYYINSFGAVVGTFLAGFYLIYHFGLAFSVTIAALVNFAVGFTAFLLSKRYEAEARAVPAADTFEEKDYYGKDIVTIAVIAIFISGFVSMLYEIVWIRLLSMILGSSTYSFSLMLAAFISGITIGSFIISKKMPRPGRTFLYFGLCELAIGLSLVLTLPFYEKLPLLFVHLSWIFSRNAETFVLYRMSQFLFSFLVMLPPTIFLGMSLPLACKIGSRAYEFLGKKVGGVIASNTAGNISGALAAGLVLVPLLGLRHALELGIVTNLALGAVMVFKDATMAVRKRFFTVLACGAIFIAYELTAADWNKGNFSAQIFRRNMSPRQFNDFVKRFDKKDILFYEDGLNDTVSVIKPEGKLFLFVNGKADASTDRDMATQILAAHIPLILKPEARDILLVGLGSGVTCGSALVHPIGRLDVVEISPSVVKASRYFSEFNHDPLDDARLRLYVEDAKTFLQRIDDRYDIIINEPSNPWMGGISGLFSTEFFTDCYRRLNDGGLMVQWVQAYEMDDETFEMILRTFSSVFPEVAIWSTGVNDVILVGSKEKHAADLSGSEKRMLLEGVRKDLERIKIESPSTFFALQLSSGIMERGVIERAGPVNSDYFPVLEYRAPLGLYTDSTIIDFLKNIDERRLPLKKGGLLLKGYLGERPLGQGEYANLYEFISQENARYNTDILPALAAKWHEEYPDDIEGSIAYASHNRASLEDAVDTMADVVEADKSFDNLDFYAKLQLERYLVMRSFLTPEAADEAVAGLARCIELSGGRPARFYHIAGKVFFKGAEYGRAIEYFAKAESSARSAGEAGEREIDRADLMNDMCMAYLKEGDVDRALQYAEKALSEDGDNARAREIIKLIGFRINSRR